MVDISKIEDRLDRSLIAAQEVHMDLGGVRFKDMGEVMEFAKLMSLAGAAVPAFLRHKPGSCLAITTRALRWGMDPFAVAEQSYAVEKGGDVTIAYMSQLVHAVVEAHAPLVGRLRYEIIGEGDERRCKVWGRFKGEKQDHVYVSETLGTMRAARGRNNQGAIKGSPLWDTQPEVQLYYATTRTWARMFCPDVLLGIYTKEEMEDSGFDAAKDVTPEQTGLVERLRNRRRTSSTEPTRGFNAQHVEDHVGGGKSTILEAKTEEARPVPGAGSEPTETPPAKPDEPKQEDAPAAGDKTDEKK